MPIAIAAIFRIPLAICNVERLVRRRNSCSCSTFRYTKGRRPSRQRSSLSPNSSTIPTSPTPKFRFPRWSTFIKEQYHHKFLSKRFEQNGSKYGATIRSIETLLLLRWTIDQLLRVPAFRRKWLNRHTSIQKHEARKPRSCIFACARPVARPQRFIFPRCTLATVRSLTYASCSTYREPEFPLAWARPASLCCAFQFALLVRRSCNAIVP